MTKLTRKMEEDTARLLAAEQLTKEQEHIRRKAGAQLESYENLLKGGDYIDSRKDLQTSRIPAVL